MQSQPAQQSAIYMMEDGTTYEVTPIRTWAYCGGRGYGWGYHAERVTRLSDGKETTKPIGWSEEMAEVGLWERLDPAFEPLARTVAETCRSLDRLGAVMFATA